MSATSQIKETQVKIENSTDLQTYFESFNKEIDDITTIQVLNDEDSGDNDDEEGGTYFVDQAGNYYYQANKNSEPVLTQPPEDLDEGSDDENGKEEFLEESDNDSKISRNVDGKTLAILKSKNNPGEVSYVLIVNEDETKEVEEDADERNEIYEFNEKEDQLAEEKPDKKDNENNYKNIAKVTKKETSSSSSSQTHHCAYCNYSSTKRYLLARHLKSHSEERPHKCSVCERGFKTIASLQNHINTHTGNKPHHCKFCDSCFTTSGELVRHVRYRHTHEKPHKCTECDYASVELSKLKRHIRCHTGERPYQCPHCTYASPDTFKLKRHLRIHTGEKPYECDICHARFTQSNSLKAHKLIHSVGEKPVFQCELCPTTCGRKTDLRIHVQKLHTSDKPLKCKRCGQLFPDRYKYKLHSKIHEGEKCYKCELCPYASISARHLESHILIHTDQKPFVCDQCDQAFRQKQLLKRHINLYHTKDYVPPKPKEKTHKCPDCGRSFTHKGNLIRHMALHDPESSVKEEQFALKIGRQKRIQLINGQAVTIGPSLEDDETMQDELEEIEANEENTQDSLNFKVRTEPTPPSQIKEENRSLLAVECADGQQYVVLEVIQVEDENPTQTENSSEVVSDEGYIMDLPSDVIDSLRNNKTVKVEHEDDDLDKKEDMDTCFGFEDECEDVEDEDTDNKATIKLLMSD